MVEMMTTITSTLRATNAFHCLDCGKCTATCPVSRVNEQFSPRKQVMKAVFNGEDGVVNDPLLWTCLTCGRCSERCPSNVDFDAFTQRVRVRAFEQGRRPTCTHGGMLQAVMRMMTGEGIKQNRLDWITDDLKVAGEGETLYFAGCLPHLQAVFSKNYGVNPIDIARSTVRILNALGIEPVVLPNERCCGHDLLWSGDIGGFRSLARLNVDTIRKSGVKQIVTSCAECASCLALDYPMHSEGLGLPVHHLSEFIGDRMGELPLRRVNAAVTFHDPCRLSRHLNAVDPPRAVLNAIPGLKLLEMPKNGRQSTCCGTSCWMNCNSGSKRIQSGRLMEAEETGSDLLVTACPKCQIHFACAMNSANDPAPAMDMKDLAVMVGMALK